MIKGIDAQIMTNRTAEYSKDVSTMLRRDEVSNDFANRLNRMESEIEQRSVTETDKMEHKRVNADDKGGNNAFMSGEEQEKGKKKKGAHTEPELPPIGVSLEERLLDIEI
ncbi:hypothetical protein LJC27_01015 [Christensenellaceae bacterium OttesenSCG-928-M15]|nr:hypothetical protein [Christensenellaceae bacterium OttesenSCG-928-M15]